MYRLAQKLPSWIGLPLSENPVQFLFRELVDLLDEAGGFVTIKDQPRHAHVFEFFVELGLDRGQFLWQFLTEESMAIFQNANTHAGGIKLWHGFHAEHGDEAKSIQPEMLRQFLREQVADSGVDAVESVIWFGHRATLPAKLPAVNSQPLKVVFAGTPEVAVPSLRAILADPRFEVVAVLTQPDRPAGRGQALQKSPIKLAAEAANLKILQPEKLKDAALAELAAIEMDFLAVVAYGLLLPQAALDLPRIAPINLHFSLLPKYRGAAPVQAAILAGDTISGVDFFHLVRALDAGDLYFRRELPLDSNKTAGEILAEYSEIGGALWPQVLAGVASGESQKTPQVGEISLAPKFDKSAGQLDFAADSAEIISRKWRAYSPWPGIFAVWQGQPVKLFGLQAAPVSDLLPGRIRFENNELLIGCAAGSAISISELQMPGGRRLPAAEFARGRPDFLAADFTAGHAG